MRPPEPLPTALPRFDSGRTAAGLGVSVVAHVLVLALAVVGARPDKGPEANSGDAPSEQQVQLMELPPLPAAAPRPRPPEREAEPAAEPPPERVARPQVRRDEALPEDVTVRPEPPPPDLPLGEIPPATAPETADRPPVAESPLSTEVATATAMESEARRLFGPRNYGADRPPGPIAARSWATEVTEDRENDCTPRPPAPREPGVPPEMGSVAGIVYREGTRQPLGGAFLQIMGTPYSTFADDRGAYELRFDKSLIDSCRTQYVQVSKDGFAPRRLILSLGHRVSNDIPMARR